MITGLEGIIHFTLQAQLFPRIPTSYSPTWAPAILHHNSSSFFNPPLPSPVYKHSSLLFRKTQPTSPHLFGFKVSHRLRINQVPPYFVPSIIPYYLKIFHALFVRVPVSRRIREEEKLGPFLLSIHPFIPLIHLGGIPVDNTYNTVHTYTHLLLPGTHLARIPFFGTRPRLHLNLSRKARSTKATRRTCTLYYSASLGGAFEPVLKSTGYPRRN